MVPSCFSTTDRTDSFYIPVWQELFTVFTVKLLNGFFINQSFIVKIFEKVLRYFNILVWMENDRALGYFNETAGVTIGSQFEHHTGLKKGKQKTYLLS